MSVDAESTETTPQRETETERGYNYHVVNRILGRTLWAYTGVVLTFLWVPLLLIVFLSFAENPARLLPYEGVTSAHYRELMTRSSMLGATGTSVFIATVSAVIATILGVLASFGIVRIDFRFKELFRVLCVLPMLVPGIIFGIDLLIFFNSLLGWQGSVMTIVLTHSVYGIPFVLLPVTARLYTFDESLEESARDLGAETTEALRDVTLPIIAPAIVAGFLFAWLRSFEDFIRVFFVGGTTDVLTVEMYGLIKFGLGAVLNPIASLIILVLAIALAIAMNAGNVAKYVAD